MLRWQLLVARAAVAPKRPWRRWGLSVAPSAERMRSTVVVGQRAREQERAVARVVRPQQHLVAPVDDEVERDLGRGAVLGQQAQPREVAVGQRQVEATVVPAELATSSR